MAATLLLGPLLRYVGETEATVWVETDGPCEVEVLGRRTPTFHVEGHHYALVFLDGLEPGSEQEYEVHLDGERHWPQEGTEFPPSVIRTFRSGDPVRMSFGSCRISLPHEAPYTLTADEDEQGHEVDALLALALRMRREPTERWPMLLMLLGDQVYADDVSPGTREFIRSRRDTSEPPGETIADFEEYTHLYWDSWQDPALRWLMSTVSTAMIFDDHDVHDDWNTSWAWVEEMRATSWWDTRIVGGLMSYWIYQHLGNLSPAQLRDDGLFHRVQEAEDAGPMLREFAFRADREVAGSRWTYCRDLGDTRLIVVDSRAGRVLRDGQRCMVDEEEWAWVQDAATGDFDHLMIATSLPLLMAPGMHHMEAWSEAVCDGVWGGAAAKAGEWLRQQWDLEHWAAFGDSFARMAGLLAEVGAGERGRAPASVTVLSGDVHHAYLAEVAFRRGRGVESAVYQAVCSPVRNPLSTAERTFMKFAGSRWSLALTRTLSRAAGVPEPDVRWRFAEDPTFDNQVATIDIEGRRAELRIEKTVPEEAEAPELHVAFKRRLA